MNLKTATLIALIGMSVHFVLGLFTMLLQFVGLSHIPYQLFQVIWLLNMIIFNGSIIFFLAVFFSKQKE
jgi:hypothetical protein